MASSTRETAVPIVQPMAPFVEFYINDVDILRDPKQQRPVRLLSFSLELAAAGPNNKYGGFTLELFDDTYTFVEEQILNILGKKHQGADTGEEGGGGDASGGTSGEGSGEGEDEKYDPQAALKFRFGYTGGPGDQKLVSTGANGEEYFYARLMTYQPTFSVNGTYISMSGSLHTIPVKAHDTGRIKSSFYGKKIYDIVKEVCDDQGWILRGTGEHQNQELPEELRPNTLLDTRQAIDSTEEQPRTIIRRPHETPYAFIQRLATMARPVSSDYGPYICYMETVKASEDFAGTGPMTYIYFGPIDNNQDPVRRYVYMRQRVTDVISFTPQHIGVPAFLRGVQSAVHKTDDVLRGNMDVKVFDESNKTENWHNSREPKGEENQSPEDGVTQEATYYNRIENKGKAEDLVVGGKVSATEKQISPDKQVVVEIPSLLENRFFADQEMLNYFLTASTMVNSATLEVVGDPSEDLLPGKLVDAFILIPVDENNLKLHYFSARWWINRVRHDISGGSYRTTLSLNKNSVAAGVTTNSNKISLEKLLDSLEEAVGSDDMKKVTGMFDGSSAGGEGTGE